MQLAPGSRFAGHEILALVGRGGMGQVYRARHEALNRVVALKVLAPIGEASELLVARFRRETRIQTNLIHPGLVRVYDCGLEGELPYLTMELVEGPGLRRVIQTAAPLPVKQVIEVMGALVDAVTYLHAHNVAHRDLKPENVLTTVDGSPKIVDFGLAKDDQHTILTHANSVIGTLRYLPPEVLLGEVVWPAADIYALGLIAYELAACVPPYRGSTMPEWVHLIETCVPIPLSDRVSGIPAEFSELVEGMLSKSARERPSARECLARLNELAIRVGVPPRSALFMRSPIQPAAESGPNSESTSPSGAAPVLRRRTGRQVALGLRPIHAGAVEVAPRATTRRRMPLTTLSLAVFMTLVTAGGLSWTRWPSSEPVQASLRASWPATGSLSVLDGEAVLLVEGLAGRTVHADLVGAGGTIRLVPSTHPAEVATQQGYRVVLKEVTAPFDLRLTSVEFQGQTTQLPRHPGLVEKVLGWHAQLCPAIRERSASGAGLVGPSDSTPSGAALLAAAFVACRVAQGDERLSSLVRAAQDRYGMLLRLAPVILDDPDLGLELKIKIYEALRTLRVLDRVLEVHGLETLVLGAERALGRRWATGPRGGPVARGDPLLAERKLPPRQQLIPVGWANSWREVNSTSLLFDTAYQVLLRESIPSTLETTRTVGPHVRLQVGTRRITGEREDIHPEDLLWMDLDGKLSLLLHQGCRDPRSTSEIGQLFTHALDGRLVRPGVIPFVFTLEKIQRGTKRLYRSMEVREVRLVND